MIAANKLCDSSVILCEMAEDICARMYVQRNILTSDHSNYTFMVNAEWLKVRQKLEKSFPDIPDLSKIVGNESFSVTATYDKILQDLEPFLDILHDMCDFCSAASKLLVDVPLRLSDFRLPFNRNVCLAYANLLRSYVRCLMMLTSIADRKTLISLLNSCNFWKLRTQLPRITDITCMLNYTYALHEHFAETFSMIAPSIGIIISQFRESIKYYSNTTFLRDKNILNPVNEGVDMARPSPHKIDFKISMSKAPVAGAADSVYVSVYPELVDADNYIEYVIYGLIACPSLLFNGGAAMQDLLRMASAENLMIRVYRDVTINVHSELELVFTTYTGIDKNKHEIKDFKWKTYLKENAQNALSDCGFRHRERRSFLGNELNTMIHLIKTSPGIIGPKFPVVLALCSMAKVELLHFFSHLNLPDMYRKDMRKYYNSKSYESYNHDVAKLLYTLSALISLIFDYSEIIISYYKEYLSTADQYAIACLSTPDTCGAVINPLGKDYQAMLQSFSNDLGGLRNIGAWGAGVPYKHSIFDNSGIIQAPTFGTLKTLRINWNRFITVLSTEFVPGARSNPSILNIASRMNEVYIRSRYVDDLDGLLKQYASPHDLWWYRVGVNALFSEVLTTCTKVEKANTGFFGSSSNGGNASTWQDPVQFVGGFLSLPASVVYNGLGEDGKSIGNAATIFLENLSIEICTHYMEVLKGLEEQYETLDSPTMPFQAVARLKRFIESRKKGSGHSSDPSGGGAFHGMPGFESEAFSKDEPNTSRLWVLTYHLCVFIKSVSSLGLLRVHDTLYDLSEHLRQRGRQYLEKRLGNILSPVTISEGMITRPAEMLRKFVILCNTVHFSFECMDSYRIYGSGGQATLFEFIRGLLFKSFCDTNTPPPGVCPIASDDRGENNALIYRIADFFVTLTNAMAKASNSGSPSCVWVPFRKNFVSINCTNKQGGGMIREAEFYLGEQDLKALCTIVGVQGVRVIDKMLLGLIAEKLSVIKNFLKNNQAALRANIQPGDFSTITLLKFSKMSDLPEFHKALVTIGVVLAVRECVHKALSQVQKAFVPYLHVMTSALCRAIDNNSVDTVTALQACQQLACDTGELYDNSHGTNWSWSCLDFSLVDLISRTLSPAWAGKGTGCSREEIIREAQVYESILQDLPSAAALLFVTPQRWDNLVFNTSLEAFQNNEHCFAFGLVKVIQGFSYLLFQLHSIIAPQGVGTQALTAAQINFNCCDSFLRFGSYVLLDMRNNEDQFRQFPTRAMLGVLELFVRLGSPMLVPSMLEKYLPYSVIHGANMDVAMGKLKSNDKLTNHFVHDASSSKEEGEAAASGAAQKLA